MALGLFLATAHGHSVPKDSLITKAKVHKTIDVVKNIDRMKVIETSNISIS